MTYFNASPDLVIALANEHIERLHADALHRHEVSHLRKTAWRSVLASLLVKAAERLEPTLKPPTLEDVTTSLSK